MRHLVTLCVAVIGVAVIVGCEKKEGRKAGESTTQPTKMMQTPSPNTTSPPVAPATPTTMPATPREGSSAADLAAKAADAATREANSQLEQVMTHIKDKKYDLADAALKKLEANKASLPTAVQPKIDSARTLLDKAMAARNGASTPNETNRPTPPDNNK